MVRQLHEFLGMFNFYRLHLLHSAAIQSPLNAILYEKVSMLKGSTPVQWTSQLISAFIADDYNAVLFNGILLVHPNTSVSLALFVDASQYAIVLALQRKFK